VNRIFEIASVDLGVHQEEQAQQWPDHHAGRCAEEGVAGVESAMRVFGRLEKIAS